MLDKEWLDKLLVPWELPEDVTVFCGALTYFCDEQRHLVCMPYSVKNLHKMAEQLNIKRCWYHSSAKFKHYDIPKKRVEEIQSKCKIVSSKEILKICK